MSTMYVSGYKLTEHVFQRMSDRDVSLGVLNRLIQFGDKTLFPEQNRVYYTSDENKVVVVCSIDTDGIGSKYAEPSIVTVLHAQHNRSIDYVKADIRRRKSR